jgi:hypothetical protein
VQRDKKVIFFFVRDGGIFNRDEGEVEIKKASSTCRNGHFRKLAPWDPELFSYPYLEMVPETGDESSIIVREHYDASAFDDLKKGSSILDVVSECQETNGSLNIG